MRNKIIFSLSLSLLLILALGNAYALYCMYCGTELPIAANFCYACGAKQSSSSPTPSPNGFFSTIGNVSNTFPTPSPTPTFPVIVMPASESSGTSRRTKSSGSATTTSEASSTTLSIETIHENADGTVTIYWSDSNPSNSDAYTVGVLLALTDDVFSDINSELLAAYATKTSSTATIVNTLVPNTSYWVIVSKADGSYTYKRFTTHNIVHFFEFGTSISLQPKIRTGNSTESVNSFSASHYASYRNRSTYGLYVRLDYPQLARPREYQYVISITDPFGIIHTSSSGIMDLSSGKTYVYWSFYSLDYYFSLLTAHYGTIPTGVYDFSLYYDGMYVSHQTFRVTN